MKIIKRIDYIDFESYKKENERISMQSVKSQINIFMQYFQYEQGIKLHIPKTIINKLNNINIQHISFEDIKLPADSIELFFDDEELSTFLICDAYSCIEYVKQNFTKDFMHNSDDAQSYLDCYANRNISTNYNKIDGIYTYLPIEEKTENETLYSFIYTIPRQYISQIISNSIEVRDLFNLEKKDSLNDFLHKKMTLDLLKLSMKIFYYTNVIQFIE